MSISSTQKILRESLPVLFGVSIFTLGAGQIMQFNEEVLTRIPAFLLAIPAFVNMAGDLAAVLCTKLTTSLHMGLIEPKLRWSKFLEDNILAIFVVSVCGFAFLGVVVSAIAPIFGIYSLPPTLSIPIIFISGLTTTFLMAVLGILIAYASFLRGWDPDNVTVPVVTTVGDFVGVSILFLVLGVFGG